MLHQMTSNEHLEHMFLLGGGKKRKIFTCYPPYLVLHFSRTVVWNGFLEKKKQIWLLSLPKQYEVLTFIILWAYLADDKLMRFFLFS